ncbi:MAG: tetratricopeptide repeat protein [Cyanobacteria bacterium P01_A01_bin.114]
MTDLYKTNDLNSNLYNKTQHPGAKPTEVQSKARSEARSGAQSAPQPEPDLIDALNCYYEQALDCARAGQNEAAIAVYREAIQAFPNEDGPYIALGDFLIDQQHYDEAIATFEAALRSANIQNRLFYRSYANALFAKGNYKAAATVYDQVIAKHPSDYNAHTRRIVLLAMAGELAVASTNLIGLAQHSEDIAYLVDEAVAQTMAVYQQYTAGIRLFQTVLNRIGQAHSPVRIANIHKALGSLWIDHNQPGGAISHLKSAQAIYQEYGMTHEAEVAEAMLESIH